MSTAMRNDDLYYLRLTKILLRALIQPEIGSWMFSHNKMSNQLFNNITFTAPIFPPARCGVSITTSRPRGYCGQVPVRSVRPGQSYGHIPFGHGSEETALWWQTLRGPDHQRDQ